MFYCLCLKSSASVNVNFSSGRIEESAPYIRPPAGKCAALIGENVNKRLMQTKNKYIIIYNNILDI